MKKRNVFINSLFILSLSWFNNELIAQTETFEDETNLATTFTTTSKPFSLSGMRVSNAPGFGAGSSNFFIETPFGTPSSGGTISKSGSVASFKLTSLDAWTSNDAGNTFRAGVNVRFTGNQLGGGTVTQDFTVNPTGNAGTQWHFGLTFNGTFQAAILTSLQVTILGTGNAANYIALDNIAFSSIVLPVELLNFTATTEGGGNNLRWTTASELNNKGFDIERSADGTDFTPIGTVKAANKASMYQFIDTQPFATSYYRLRQIDFDGTETYSKVVSISSISNKSNKGLKVYPTLVSNGVLTVDTERGDYAIYNIYGQQVQNGKETQQLDVSTLAKGTYILRVGIEQAKFVKQ